MCHDDATEGWQCGHYSCPSVHENTNVDRRIEVLSTLEGGFALRTYREPHHLSSVRSPHPSQAKSGLVCVRLPWLRGWRQCLRLGELGQLRVAFS